MTLRGTGPSDCGTGVAGSGYLIRYTEVTVMSRSTLYASHERWLF